MDHTGTHSRPAPVPAARAWILMVLFSALPLAGQPAGQPAELQPPDAGLDIDADLRRDATVLAIERVLPAVVNIYTRSLPAAPRTDPVERMIEEFFGYRSRQPATFSRGSGVVIDPEGYVLTNVHVVGNAEEVRVQFGSSGESLPARRVALSAGRDVALLRIEAPAGRIFRSVPMAADDDLYLGETVLALGNPFGLGGSVSRGILSAKTRRPAGDEPDDGRLEWQDWLQTDAAINPGNSGGPLVNLKGELIGINVAVLRVDLGAQGIGFAIPNRQIREALAETLSGEAVEGLWFGARLEPELRQLTVRTVQPGSPADAAGLVPGDVILEVDREATRGLIEFNRRLVAAGRDRPLELRVRRAGATRQLTLRLVAETDYFNTGLIRQRLGITVRPVRGALQIQAVETASQAARQGLRAGMYIIGHDGQAGTTDVVGLARTVHGRKAGEPILLDILIEQGWRRQRAQVRLAIR